MGSVDVVAICQSFKARLATIEGLHASSEEPDKINWPAAWPALVGITFDETFDQDEGLRFEINVAAAPSGQGLAKGYQATFPYLSGVGAKSIKTAIELDVTLGGLVSGLAVAEAAAIGEYEKAGLRYVGGKLSVLVYT